MNDQAFFTLYIIFGKYLHTGRYEELKNLITEKGFHMWLEKNKETQGY